MIFFQLREGSQSSSLAGHGLQPEQFAAGPQRRIRDPVRSAVRPQDRQRPRGPRSRRHGKRVDGGQVPDNVN